MLKHNRFPQEPKLEVTYKPLNDAWWRFIERYKNYRGVSYATQRRLMSHDSLVDLAGLASAGLSKVNSLYGDLTLILFVCSFPVVLLTIALGWVKNNLVVVGIPTVSWGLAYVYATYLATGSFNPLAKPKVLGEILGDSHVLNVIFSPQIRRKIATLTSLVTFVALIFGNYFSLGELESLPIATLVLSVTLVLQLFLEVRAIDRLAQNVNEFLRELHSRAGLNVKRWHHSRLSFVTEGTSKISEHIRYPEEVKQFLKSKEEARK